MTSIERFKEDMRELEAGAVLLAIRDHLRRGGFDKAVEEITEHLRIQEEAEQPGLFPGPLFEKGEQ